MRSYVEAMKRILRIHMEVLMERGDFLSAFGTGLRGIRAERQSGAL